MSFLESIRAIVDVVGAELPERSVADAKMLLEHHEYGVALSLICTQLYEYDVPISWATWTKIEQIAKQMSMPDDEWLHTKALTKM